MSILDRYIARQYLVNILALWAILFSFVVTIDVSINIDRFWSLAAERGTTPDGPPGLVRRLTLTLLLIADLWWPRLLQLYNMMLGIVLVGAMGFTCTQLVRHREMVAVLASGQSLRRAAAPILAVALGMIALAAVNQEAMLPRIAPLLTRDHDAAGNRDILADAIPLATDNQNRLLYARQFDAAAGRLSDFLFIERDDRGVGTRHISGSTAAWDGSAWLCDDATVDPLTDGAQASTGVAVRVQTDLDPTALTVIQYAGFSQNLSWRQIGRLLEQTRGGDRAVREKLQRTRFGRLSLAFTNLLTLVLTMPFFLQRMPGNTFASALRGAPVAVVSIVGGTLGATAPVPGFPDAVAVFVPVLVLAPLAVAVALNPKT